MKDLIPERYRKKVYALVSLAAAVFGIWQAAEGSWDVFAASVLTFLTTSLATANTDGPLIPKRNEEGVSDVVFVLGVLLLLGGLYLILGR